MKHLRILQSIFISLLAVSVHVSGQDIGQDSQDMDSDRALLEDIVSSDIERRTITESDLDSENFELGAYLGVMSVEDFGSNPVYGFSLAYHISEDFFIEGNYGQTELGETSFERLSGDIEILTDEERQMSFYNVAVGYQLFPGEIFVSDSLAFNSSFFLIAGAGNSDFANESHFTYSLGAGYRLIANDWLALRLDVRDNIFDHDLLGETLTTHNLSMQLGLTFFF